MMTLSDYEAQLGNLERPSIPQEDKATEAGLPLSTMLADKF